MGRRKYDKALGLEIEPIDDLKSYNPNIVSKDDGFSDLNIKDAKYEASTLGQLNAQSPYFQESVGQFFPSEKHAQYAEREELTPYDLNDINEVAFRNQGNWETLGNAFASRAISIIPKTLNMFGTVGGLVGAGAEYASDLANPNVEANWAMSASKNLDNAWVNAMNSFDEGLKDKFPVFGSKYGYYSGSLSDNIKSAKFWEEDGFDGLAFTASAMLPGMGMAKAFQLIGATAEGASMLGWLGRIGNAGATSEAALAAGTDIANTVTTGLINTTHEAGLEAYDWMKNLDENKTKQNLLSSDPELKSEINNLKNLQKEYESAPNELSFTGTDGRTIPTRKMLLAKKIDELTNSLEKNLDDKYKKFRAEGAANVANWNMAVLAGPDLFQAKMFTKAFGETSKLMNEASRSGERAVRASVLKNMGKEFAIGFGREGMWEENAQTSVSSYYNKKAYGETHLDDFDGILNEAVRNVTFQDKEGAKAIILGGASGGMTSAIFGGIDQKKKNLAADIQEKDFKKILEMSNTAVTDFYDRSKNILDADGNVSFENAVKAFTYTLGRKRNIDADQISTLYDNGTLNSLIKNDELARVFIEHMNMIGPRGFMNEAEAIESLKNKLQKNKDDQNPTDQSDAFASKIDLLKENYNKAKSIVEKNINNKHQESVDHKDLMVKTLFIALNKQSELSGILKDNDTVFNDKQKESISSLINDYSDAASHFTTRDGLTRVANGLSKAANEYNSIRKELDDELNKSEADRDMSKINSLEYQLEEISEISGTINKDINGADRKVNTYGYDSFRLAISPSDVINRTNLGIRDKFFYDLGKSKLAKSELNRLLSTEVPMKDQDGNDRSADDIFSDKLELAKSIFDFVSNDNIHYISSIMKDKVLSKLSELEESNNDKLMDIEDSMESFRGAISDLEIKKLQTPELYTDEDAENESKFRDELSMLNAQYADELSKEIDFSEEKEAIEDLYKNKDNTRNEFLGKEEEAHDNGYYTNIRKRIAKDFLSATNKLIKTISSDDSFSNVNLIKSKINEVSKRIDVFSNSEYHKDLIDGYVNDMLNLKQDLEKLLEIAESNKTNRDGLDLSLNHINNRNSLNQFGIDLNESGDVVIVDNSFVDKIIGIVGVDEWNSFLNDIKTIGLEGESIFVDKFIKNIESSKKVSIIEANDEKRNSLKSKLLNKLKDNFVVATNSGAEKFNNDLFESFLGNPERSMWPLLSSIAWKTGGVAFKSVSDKKSAIDKFKVSNNLNEFLSEIKLIDSDVFKGQDRKDSLIGLVEDLISLKNATNLNESLTTNSSMEDFISEEKRSLEEINIAPSKQQRNTIKKIFKWFGNNEYNPSNGFSSILMVNGIAGTGKTTVLSKILFKILSKTNGIDINKNIVVAGSNEHVANALADSIGKATSNLTYGFNELMNSEIASDIKIIVFDELGALTRDQLLLLKQKIEDVNSKRQSAPVKVLALGDPNQLSKSILMEGSALNANNIDGKFDINAIKSIEALSVQYRSDVDAINEASDMFSGKSSDVYGVPAKASCNLSDVSNKNPYGIHAPKSMSDFMDRVKASMDGSRSMPIIIAYNTTSELNELNAQIPDEIKKNVQFVQMYDVQGRTLDQLFIYVKKSGVLSDLAGEVNVSKYNAAMYMLLSRATDYACVYNENGTFNQDVDGASIKNSLNKNKEQLEKSKITYEGIVTTEDKIINDGETKSKNKIDETKSKFDFVEPEIDKIDYPEIDAHADDVDDDIEAANASIDEVLEANNSVEKELFIDKDTQISQDSSLNDIDSNEKTKIKNTTASNIKRTNLKAGDDISVINAFKGDKALYLLVKEHEGKFYTVGTLSESEAKSLGISNSNFNQDYSIEERPDGVYDSISGISATKNGNEIKLKVSDVKHAKIEYKQDNKTGGAGFLNNILASVINKFGIKSDGSVSKSIFIKTLSSKDNKDMHLELGVPYMIIKWGKSGGKLYIRLEPKAFSRSNQWITYKGSNAFDALESFTLAIKGVESWLSRHNIDIRLGDIDFANLINQIAMSKYFTIDEKTGDIKMQSINIDSISEIFKNEKYSNFIDAIFDGDVNMFKDFVWSNKNELKTIVKSLYDTKSKNSEFLLNNETLVKYGMQESYAAFLEFNSSVIDLLSTKQDIEEAIGSSNFDFDIKKSLKTLASSSNYNDIVHTVLEAFENNKLFIKGGTEAIAKSLVSDETSNEFQKTLIAARALRDAYKAYLNKSPIYGVVDGKRYEWVPNKESSKTKGSYQNHFIEESDANVRIGEKDSNFKILTHYTLSKSNSEIQSILNNLVLANSTINGKNFRVNNSSTKAKKTGRKIESVKILNTDGLVYDDNGNSTNVGINKFAQSHDLSVSNIDELNANAESYTIRSEDLEYIVSDGSKVRRNIILDEVARANMSDDGWSDFESKVESNFSIAQPTELYVINDGVRPSNGVTADSQSSGTITDNKDSVEPDGLSLVSADEIPDVDIDELLFEKSEDSENMLGAEVSLESAMEYLSRLFPGVPTSTFKFLNEIRTSSKKAYGRFVRGVIEVEKASSNTVFENVVRHEAFHKVWNEYMPYNTKIEIAKSYVKTLSESNQLSLKEKSIDEVFALIEEGLARSYQIFNKNRGKNIGSLSKAMMSLKKIFRELLNIVTSRENDLNHFFDLIDHGYFNKKYSNFRGSRNYNGILKDFKTFDNYVTAKGEVSDMISKLISSGRKNTLIPFSNAELNEAILQRVLASKRVIEDFISKNKGNSDVNILLKISDLEAKLNAYNTILSSSKRIENGTTYYSYNVFSKILDELLPGRVENKLVAFNEKVVKDDIDVDNDLEDGYEDDDSSSIEDESTPATQLSVFKSNSSEVDHETKVFASVKNLLFSIRNIKTNKLINNRFSFLKIFKLMEGLNNEFKDGESIFSQIRDVLSMQISGSTSLSDMDLMKDHNGRNDVSIYFGLKKIYDEATMKTYSPDFAKENPSLLNKRLRSDVTAFVGSNGDIKSFAYNKNGNPLIGKFKHQLKNESDVEFIEIRDGESQSDFANRCLSVVSKKNSDGILSIAALMKKELARNKWNEIQNTFTSLKESKLNIIKIKEEFGKISIKNTQSGKASASSLKVKEQIVSKFKSKDDFLSLFKDENNKKLFSDKTIIKKNKEESDSEFLNRQKEFVNKFLNKIGVSVKGDNKAWDYKYADLATKIHFFFADHASGAIERLESISKSIDAVEAQEDKSNDEVDVLDSNFIDNMFSDEGSIIEMISSLTSPEDTGSKTGSYKNASGKKQYTITPSTFANTLIKKLLLRSKGFSRVNLNKYMSLPYMRRNIFTIGLQRIHDYTLHNAIQYSNNYSDPTIVEFDKEGFSQYVTRVFFGGFLSNFLKNKDNYTYDQYVYIKSNRSDTESAKIDVLRESIIFNAVIPSIFNQMIEQDISVESKIKGFKVDAFVNMTVLKEAINNALKDSDLNFKSFVNDKVYWTNLDESIKTKIIDSVKTQFEAKAKDFSRKIIVENVKLDENHENFTKNLYSFLELSKDTHSSDMSGISKNQSSGKKAKENNSGVFSNRQQYIEKAAYLFLMNNYFNSYQLNQLFAGNNNFYGSGAKLLKRMSIVFGPGLSPSVGQTGMRESCKIVVIDDLTYNRADRENDLRDKAKYPEHVVSQIMQGSGKGDVEYSDGQGLITPERHEELVRGYGTSYGLKTIGKPLWYSIDDNGIPRALKYSWTVLTDELCSSDNTGQLSKLRDNMRKNDIGEAVFKSAMKVGVPSKASSWGDLTSKDIDTINDGVIIMNNSDYKLQLNPAHTFGTNHVAIPTQIMYILNILKVNEAKANKAYNAYSKLISLGAKTINSKIDKDGNIDNNKLTELLKTKFNASPSAQVEAEMLDAGISQDFPTLSDKIVSQMASMFAKNTINAKFKGGKAVLLSSAGFKNKNGDILSYHTETIDGKSVTTSEFLISKEAAKAMFDEDTFSKMVEASNAGSDTNMLFATGDLLGFRIPSSELHSGLALKFAGFSENTGNSIIVPQWVVEIHGSDFDVDSLFVIAREFIYKNKDIINYKLVDGRWEAVELSDEQINSLSNDDKKKYYKNIVVEAILSALIDRENALRVESPISVEKLRDTAKGIKTELGESIEDEDLDLSDFMDGFSAHQSSHNGSTGTGIGASAFKTISYLVRTGVEDSVPIIDLNINDNKLIVNGKAITKMSNDIGLFESLDALINAAIDNVKEQILPYFNLNGNTFSTFVGMMSCDGVGLDFAGRMAKQKVFQQVADSKGLTRNFGFNETSSIMSELVGAVSGKNTNFNDSPENELTTEYLKDALMLGKTLGVETLKDYHASIMSGERSITDDDIQFIRMQSHIFDHYKQFSKYGEALTKVSGYLSILRDMPTKQIDIEKKIELENDLFNENGSSKDDFPIKINDMFNSSPHIKAASETLHRLNEINSLFLFKHGAIARSFVDKIIELSSSIIEDTNTQSDEESSSESVSSLNSSIDSKVKMRDELITFLINCVNWDGEFHGYNNIKPVTVHYGNRSKKISGSEAFKYHFGNKILALKSYLKENGIENEFMNELVGRKQYNGTTEFNMPMSVEFKAEDIFRLKAAFETLTKYELVYSDESRSYTVKERNDSLAEYSEWQKDFVRYGVMKNGMSFGATNFSLALPDNLIKRLSDGLVDIIDDIKNNPELLMRNSNEFMYQFLLNNPSVVKLNMDKAIQLSNGNYSGSEIVNNRQVFFDLKIDRKLEAPQSIIRRSGSKRSYIYKLISVSDESLYYTKIGGESMSSYYNMTKDKFTNPSDTLVIDSSIPNIQVASTSDSSFDITDSVAKVIRDEFGDSAFMATLNMYEDPTRRDSVKKLVQLSGNKLILSTNDVYYIDNTIDDISWESNKDLVLKNFSDASKDEWNSMSPDKRRKILECLI